MEREFDELNNKEIQEQEKEELVAEGTKEAEEIKVEETKPEHTSEETSNSYGYSFWAEQVAATKQENEENEKTESEETQLHELFYDIEHMEKDEAGPEEIEVEIPEKKKSHRLAKGCIIVACGVLVGLGSFGVYKALHPTEQKQTVGQSSIPQAGTDSNQEDVISGNQENDTQEGSGALTENNGTGSSTIAQTNTNTVTGENGVVSVVDNVMPSIVKINTVVEQTNYFGQTYSGTGSGSGIIIKQENDKLLVVTNYHVVEESSKIDVIFDDEEAVSAEVKGYDSVADLAVLEVKLSDMKDSTVKNIKVATLGSSEDLKVGQMAIAIGNALGYGQSVTVGYLSAKDRTVDVNGSSMVLLQTDAAINPGNSGGALLNLSGEVIGINSVKFSSEDVEGMGYAIPVSNAIPIINELMDREVLTEEEKGYLGISGQDVDETASSNFNMPAGVFVNQVSEGGAADVAGIKANDIITKINEIQVTSIEALAERVNSYRKGTKITLTIQRQVNSSYEEMQIEVTLQGKETLDSLESSDSSTNSDSSSDGSTDGNSQSPYGSNGGNSQSPYGSSDDFYNNFPWNLFQ